MLSQIQLTALDIYQDAHVYWILSTAPKTQEDKRL